MSTASELAPKERRRLWFELGLVAALSLGQSAVYAVVRLLDIVTRGPISDAEAKLNTSLNPRPIFDLVYQLLDIGFSLVPVALALYLLTRDPDPKPLAQRLGVQGKAVRDFGQGVLLFLVIGLGTLAVYAGGRALGITAEVRRPTSAIIGGRSPSSCSRRRRTASSKRCSSSASAPSGRDSSDTARGRSSSPSRSSAAATTSTRDRAVHRQCRHGDHLRLVLYAHPPAHAHRVGAHAHRCRRVPRPRGAQPRRPWLSPHGTGPPDGPAEDRGTGPAGKRPRAFRSVLHDEMHWSAPVHPRFTIWSGQGKPPLEASTG